jgi:KaiC/GvpD/RAD55 family RecA-like ATPase
MGLTIELTDDEAKYAQQHRTNYLPNYSWLADSFVPAYDRAIQAQANQNIIENLFEDKGREIEMIENLKPMFGSFFNVGETIVLASSGGTGKSLLSIEVAKSKLIKKALFLTIEDYSKNQLPRYLAGLEKDRFEIISGAKWRNLFNMVKKSIKDGVNFQVMMESATPMTFQHMQRRREHLLRQYGINEAVFLDNLLVFEILMEQICKMGFDFVCVDSLNALFGHPSKISRTTLERLISIPTAHKITLLLIHHINKKGEITGTSDIVNVVDSVYTLTKDSQKDNETTLILEEVKSRHKDQQEKAKIVRRKVARFKVDHEITETSNYLDASPKDMSAPLQQAIMDALRDSETGKLTKKELNDSLAERGFSNVGSNANIFKILENKGLVKKGDGKSWNTIEMFYPDDESEDE